MQTTEVTASDPLPPPSGHDPPRSPKPRRLALGPQDTRDMHGWTRIAITSLHTAERKRKHSGGGCRGATTHSQLQMTNGELCRPPGRAFWW